MSGKIRSLDGLRAVSISLVLLGHLEGTKHFPHLGLGRFAGDYSNLGVIVFFVVSGYLITTLLLNEYSGTGEVRLGLFYIRRGLRILPPFLAFMAATLVLAFAGWTTVKHTDLLLAFTYTVNYSLHPSWAIGHLWSLSVEEQFYLLWPFTVKRLKPERAMRVAMAVFLLAPITRAVMLLVFRHDPRAGVPIFPAVADGLAIGCLMAGFRSRLIQQRWYLRLTEGVPVAGYVLLIFCINRFRGYSAVTVLGVPVMLIAIALCMESCIRHSDSLAGRILNSRPFVWVGLLSYSLYLWQQMFLNRASQSVLSEFPSNLLLAFGAASLSYYALERPLLRLRKRFSPHAPARVPAAMIATAVSS